MVYIVQLNFSHASLHIPLIRTPYTSSHVVSTPSVQYFSTPSSYGFLLSSGIQCCVRFVVHAFRALGTYVAKPTSSLMHSFQQLSCCLFPLYFHFLRIILRYMQSFRTTATWWKAFKRFRFTYVTDHVSALFKGCTDSCNLIFVGNTRLFYCHMHSWKSSVPFQCVFWFLCPFTHWLLHFLGSRTSARPAGTSLMFS